MRVVHLSTTDASGGAARAAYRLHTGLRNIGTESLMYVQNKNSADETVNHFTLPMKLPVRLRRRLRRSQIGKSRNRYRGAFDNAYDYFSDDRSEHNGNLLRQLPPCDLVNLHLVSGFLDFEELPALCQNGKILIWTLHDMNPFTGGCHYDQFCGRYVSQCGSCPQLGKDNNSDLSSEIWQRKMRVFERLRTAQLHIVAPSHWLATEAMRSTLLSRFPVTVIPNGLDINAFAPRDRSFAREVLGLPQVSKVVLFVAEKISLQRKGFALLAEALAGLEDVSDLVLITLGSSGQQVSDKFPQFHLGQTNNDRLLSLIYSAADVFVIPSVQDNLPCVVQESLACGTPVIGFETGGITDMVRPGITGLLAPRNDTGSLRACIRELLLDDSFRLKLATNCREVAVKEYNLELQARRYLDLYKTILGLPEIASITISNKQPFDIVPASNS